MAKTVDKYDIELMQELYNRLGTYSAVAKELGMSPSTVSKYLKTNPIQSTAFISNEVGPQVKPKPVEEIQPIGKLSDWFRITDEEIHEAELFRRKRFR